MHRRWKPRGLRTRLALAAGGSILLAVSAFGLAAVLLVQGELRRSLDGTLRQRAIAVAQLAVTAPAVLTGPGALESTVGGRQVAVEVFDSHGRLVVRSLALGARVLPVDTLARRALTDGTAGYADTVSGGLPYRLFAAPIPRSAGDPASGGAVLVGSDTSDISQSVRRLGAAIRLSAVGAALIAVALAATLTRRGLRPLRRLAAAAGEIERTADPTRRLPDPAAADEISELTGVLNRMLDSLAAARAGERRFLADASHELRTPVTSLLGNVEYAARHGADPEVLADLRADAGRLARLVDSLLVLERAGAEAAVAGAGADELVDLGTVVRDAAAAVGDGRVDVDAGEAVVRGDPEALRRAVANLIENGLVHGPPGGRVAITVSRAGGEVRVAVCDEGSGPAPDARPHLFERFWRAPDAAGRPGSGLGLAIVEAIARRHGGRVEVEGSAFTVVLPAARAAA